MDQASALPSTFALPQATPAQLARVQKVSREFESSFLSVMLGQMTAGMTSGSFGGGAGEDAFKSFMSDAMAKSMTARGGVGLAPRLESELLKLQGLSR